MPTTERKISHFDHVCSIDETHVCGVAHFTDGKVYQFAMRSGKLFHLAIPDKTWDGKPIWKDRDPLFATRRCWQIEGEYERLLPLGQAEKAKTDADREKSDAELREKYRLEKALNESAPKLLAAAKVYFANAHPLLGGRTSDPLYQQAAAELLHQITKAEGK